MSVKEESEKADLKLNSQKTKIMSSGPITSWQTQTAKGYGNASSVRGKKRAIGWILQLLHGCTASAPHGEHDLNNLFILIGG